MTWTDTQGNSMDDFISAQFFFVNFDERNFNLTRLDRNLTFLRFIIYTAK